MDTKPTYEQAQLHLQVFEMRREPRLRQARDWFFKNFFAENFEEGMRIASPGSENGTLFMMVLSYWEQACALLNSGLLHDELFFKTSGEFFGVWERINIGVFLGWMIVLAVVLLARGHTTEGRAPLHAHAQAA